MLNVIHETCDPELFSDFVRCVLTSSVSKIQTCSSENVIAVESTYDVTSAMTLPDHDYISPAQLQRLRRRLRHQVKDRITFGNGKLKTSFTL